MRIHKIMKRSLSFLLTVSMLAISIYGCGRMNEVSVSGSSEQQVREIDAQEIAQSITEEIEQGAGGIDLVGSSFDQFVNDQIFSEYSLCYETFNAAVTLSDGTEVYGIGYSDFSSLLECDDDGKDLFPAGFLILNGDLQIPQGEIEAGLEIINLDYEHPDYGFFYAYDTESYFEHCVIDGKYLKYGVDINGMIAYTSEDYSSEICDTSLGALYSYDEDKYLYDPDVGEYMCLTGDALYEIIDFDELEAEVNRILEEQDFNFSSVDIETTAHFAQEAVNSYLLSMQEETFMGCDVDELVEEVSKLDPMQCIRITPEGNVVIDIEKDFPQKPSVVAKWTVGMGCGIAVVGSIALGVFVPAATPASGAICGAAIDAFMQVVIENNAVEDINWTKVAISATSGAIMAWACPLGASAITETIAGKTGSAVLSKLAGYGFQTFGNAAVSGVTNAAYTIVDGEGDVWDAFLTGAAVGACCTVAASALSEVGHGAMNALRESHSGNWFVKLSDKASAFISNHQYQLSNAKVESILSPKSVYEASKAGVYEYNQQMTLNTGLKGGSYKDVKVHSNGDYAQVHETPSFASTGAAKRENGPSIKMTKEDHQLTASYGNSKDAQQYIAAQKSLIEQGNYHDAIQMDISDIQSKFGDKYDDAISEMIEYAKQIGWW